MVNQTPWIPYLNRFLSLLDSGNENFELDYEDGNDYDAGEDDDDAYNESSDKECKDFWHNYEYWNHSLWTADCPMTNKN